MGKAADMVEKDTVSIIDKLEQKRDTPGLLKALNHKKDPNIRRCAIDALGRLRSAEAGDALLEILKNDNDQTARERAIFALGLLNEKRAWVPIIEILKDSKEPENIRWAAAEAISYYKDLRAIEPLLDALEYTRGRILINVVLSLGQLKNKCAVGPLVKLFEKELTKSFTVDDDWLVLINTAIAFQKFGDPRAIKPLSNALKFDRTSFPNCEGRCGDLQREALNALGKIKDKRAFDLIIDTLESEDFGLKLNCVDVLKNIENRKVLAPLYRALRTNWNNKPLVEGLQNAISEIEKYAKESCYYCGEDLETRIIRMIYKPANRRICAMCWKDLKREQENPNTRTVVECGWDNENLTVVTSEKRRK